MIRFRSAAYLAILVSLAACSHNKGRAQADIAASKVTTIGVNAYLWRASLDTLSFMPLLQTDSNGGVIVTDWYVNPNTPGERMKVTVTVLDQDLRADAIRVAALRELNQNGQWVAAPVKAATVQKLEDIILTRARDLRRAAVVNK
jgi:DNA-binding cell septation regulator SpoVG